MSKHGARWIARIAALAALLLTSALVAPVEACGCGGYVPHGGDAYVSQEQALLRWDGQTEDILMSLGVLGSSQDAAVILPVPAQATVKLGQAAIWDQLDELTRPVIVTKKRLAFPFPFMGGAAAAPGAAAPVTVLSRQTLGPFDVSNLAATDASALADWLNQNGYQLSPGLAQALQPYVAEGWFYVAVRLSPGSGTTLSGALDPLQVTFASTSLVYPMRASANARGPETVTVYVLANHRVQKTQNFGSTHTGFADWVDPAAAAAGTPLASFVDRRLFLTKFVDQVDPAQVNDDFHFTIASSDEAAHDVIVDYEDDYSWFYLLCGGLCLVVVLGVAGVTALVLRRGRQRPGGLAA